MNHRHDRRTFYRSSRDADKLREQVLFDEVRQRQRVEDLAHQIGPVFEQEKQQVQHNAEANSKAERPFTNQERATRQILSAL